MNPRSISRLIISIAATMSIPGCMADSGTDESVTADPETPSESTASSEVTSNCIQIGVTTQTGSRFIHGYASVSCAGSSANISIRRQRFFVGDDEFVTTPVSSGQGDVHVTYDCIGTGVHNFYTRIWGFNGIGDYVFKDSNNIRVSCP